MHVAAKKVVSIHYTLRDETGEVLDTSRGRDPLDYIHGEGHIISGLEKALEGKKAGEDLSVVIPPEDGYGVRDESLVYLVPRDRFDMEEKIEVGMQFRAGTDQGTVILNVTDLDGDNVKLDGNHPLAGMSLAFEVSIVGVRDATEDEMASVVPHDKDCGSDCDC